MRDQLYMVYSTAIYLRRCALSSQFLCRYVVAYSFLLFWREEGVKIEDCAFDLTNLSMMYLKSFR